MIGDLFNLRANGFITYPSIPIELDLIYEQDKHTHMLEYLHICDPESTLGKTKH
jgi:hypothetical protein